MELIKRLFSAKGLMAPAMCYQRNLAIISLHPISYGLRGDPLDGGLRSVESATRKVSQGATFYFTLPKTESG